MMIGCAYRFNQNRSSKSALHGLVHWLSQWYGPKGITVNGVAPALIQDTKMLPGDSGELAKSKWSVIRGGGVSLEM